MSFDYFYGQQSDLFTFYRVPKVLFTNERFWNISADAKMLYGILLDRMSLSAKNGWIDKNGRVYIIFTIDEAKMALNCAEQKAIKLLSELEKKAGLIERKRQGLGKPNLIYVKNFISAVDSLMLFWGALLAVLLACRLASCCMISLLQDIFHLRYGSFQLPLWASFFCLSRLRQSRLCILRQNGFVICR